MSTVASGSLQSLFATAQIPALPQSAVRLLELAQDPENGPSEYALPIEADPGLSTQVLRFVNSSYFGFSREISSVRHALSLVGPRAVKNFVLWSAVFGISPKPKCGPFDVRALWQDSLRRGLFARSLGKHLGKNDSEDVFTAALLQDMAIPLLASQLPKEYGDLLERRQQGKTRLSDLEEARFGWNHASAAGILARQWHLPERFATLIEKHLHFDDQVPGNAADAEVAVALSSLLPASKDNRWPEAGRFVETFERVGGSEKELQGLFASVDEQFEKFAPMLNLSSPIRGLKESIRDAHSPAS
jgi:HD-like signal output (HDOD) protein